MYDLISVGTLTVDMYFQSTSLTYLHNRFVLAVGGKYFTDHFYESLGGGATNVAIGVQKHGWRTSLKTIIGNGSFKSMITGKLRKEGVSYFHSHFVDNHLNISSILLSSSGEKTVINYQTPHQQLFKGEQDFNSLLRSKVVFVGNLPDVSLTQKKELFHYLHRNNRICIANLGVMDCRRPESEVMELLEYIDVLIINGHEFADLVKMDYNKLNFKQNVIESYITPKLKSKKIKTYIITDGEKGSYGYLGNEVYFQKAISPPKIVDSTGAGDGYTAGFIAKYLKTKDIPLSMLSGAEYASKILGKIGAN